MRPGDNRPPFTQVRLARDFPVQLPVGGNRGIHPADDPVFDIDDFTAALFEKLDAQRVAARVEKDLPGDRYRGVQAVIVDHQRILDVEPGAVIGSGAEFVGARVRNRELVGEDQREVIVYVAYRDAHRIGGPGQDRGEGGKIRQGIIRAVIDAVIELRPRGRGECQQK